MNETTKSPFRFPQGPALGTFGYYAPRLDQKSDNNQQCWKTPLPANSALLILLWENQTNWWSFPIKNLSLLPTQTKNGKNQQLTYLWNMHEYNFGWGYRDAAVRDTVLLYCVTVLCNAFQYIPVARKGRKMQRFSREKRRFGMDGFCD